MLFSGRTPTTESGRLGSRTVPIGWGQEMRDQTALVREASKWDYELRFPEQALELIDRAYAIATSTPKGPVYLSLPREVLCGLCPADELDRPSRMQPVSTAAPAALVQQAAAMLADAEPRDRRATGPGSADAFATLGNSPPTGEFLFCSTGRSSLRSLPIIRWRSAAIPRRGSPMPTSCWRSTGSRRGPPSPRTAR